MRLWSLHPQYLDARGLVAVWREGLLAQAVLSGGTRGYRNHPQLERFKQASRPEAYIAAYLQAVFTEACRRGYRFDQTKVGRMRSADTLLVTEGQMAHEWTHLKNKLNTRAPGWLSRLEGIMVPDPHPLFHVVTGNIAEWEVVANDSHSQ